MRRGQCLAILSLAWLFASCQAGQTASEAESESAAPAPRIVERTVPFAGGPLHYRVARAGDESSEAAPLLFVHGWASTSWAWHQQLSDAALEVLASDRRLIVLDLPGHGASSDAGSEVPYSIDTFTDAMRVVLDQEGDDDAILVGHSNGTPVIVRFYRRFPERAAGLVAVDGQMVALVTEEMLAPMMEQLEGDEYRAAVSGLVQQMAGESFDDETVQGLQEMAATASQRALVESIASATDPAIWSDESIEVPVRLVLAEQPTWSEQYQERVNAMVPEATWEIWSGANHFLQLERPDDFNRVVREWLVESEL